MGGFGRGSVQNGGWFWVEVESLVFTVDEDGWVSRSDLRVWV